jgi:hypothetical protein
MTVHVARCEGQGIEAFDLGPLRWLDDPAPPAPPELMDTPPAPYGTQYGRDWWEVAEGCYLVAGHDLRAAAAARHLTLCERIDRGWVQFWRLEAGYDEWAIEWADEHAPGAVAVTKNAGW